jgi:hypothetical protein
MLCGAALVGVALGSAAPAAANQAPDNNGPGVARMSVVQGSTVIQRGDSNTQSDAVVNAPLLPGDYVSTGDSSRAELQYDGATAIRLGGNMQARVTNNDPNNRSLQLADGTIEVGLVKGSQAFQVDTPSVSVRAREAGDYRISIDRDGSTWVTARRGKAQVATANRTYDLSPGRTLVARGSASDPSISYASEVGYDAFDDFNAKRDQQMIAADNASPNLSPTIAGYDDLGQYGNWEDVSGYGDAWVPQQSTDWAPYRDGSWVWEGGYGWTWVGDEPWGWAPYHYGRWFWANGYGWAWLPPAYAYDPTWYPALVGFYGYGDGYGDGVSLDFGFPCIGWVPLAPFETFYAWYPGWSWGGRGWGFRPGWGGWGRRIAGIGNIGHIYRNFGHGGGSGTLRGKFGNGKLGRNTPVTTRNMGRVGQLRGSLPVTPTRSSLGVGRTPSSRVAFSHEFQSQRFASNPQIRSRESFSEQQHTISTAMHSNADRATDTRSMTPVTRQNAPTSSWNRFNSERSNEPAARANVPEARTNTIESRPAAPAAHSAPTTSWNRFSSDRGSIAPSYSDRGSYGSSASRGESYTRTSSGNSEVYTRSSAPSYARSPSESQSRASYPSYSHGASYPSYSHGSSYPSYSRGSSYPSYSHGSSYPSYSRGASGQSYSRPSAPSYSRGSAPSSGSAQHGSSGNSGSSHGGHPPQP